MASFIDLTYTVPADRREGGMTTEQTSKRNHYKRFPHPLDVKIYTGRILQNRNIFIEDLDTFFFLSK